jgi:hypothetical protein
MKSSLNKLLGYSAAMLLYACSGSPATEVPNEIYFTDNITVYPAGAFPTDTLLSGDIIIDEVMGARDASSGQGIIAIPTPDDSPLFKLYTPSGDSIGAYGIKGQGPDDFYNTNIIKVDLADNGDTCLWVNDVSNKQFKRLNISLSRRTGSARVDSTIQVPFGVVNGFLAGNRAVMELMDNNSYKLMWRDVDNTADTIHTEQMYIYPTEDFYAFYSNANVAPDGKHVVYAMSYFNQVNIIDIPSMERRAVSIGNINGYEDSYNSLEREPKFKFYGAVACGNDSFCAIYKGTPYDNETESDYTTVHSFNYDGSVRGIYALPGKITSLFFNPESGKFCGIDDDDRVIQYNIQ